MWIWQYTSVCLVYDIEAHCSLYSWGSLILYMKTHINIYTMLIQIVENPLSQNCYTEMYIWWSSNFWRCCLKILLNMHWMCMLKTLPDVIKIWTWNRMKWQIVMRQQISVILSHSKQIRAEIHIEMTGEGVKLH